ncbi:MAG TPA: aspartyl protease family protein [Pyrinomonadaceae bacterium]|jgi:hypothetical protein
MIFEYTVFPDDTVPKGYVEIPLLDVRLFYRGQQDDVSCLVDSGADGCMFHSSVAENLGIDLESGEPVTHYALGMTPLQCYMHTIELQIFDFDERIQIRAGFSRDSEMCVLGQDGFFENYEITFRGYEKTFEINSRPKPSNVLPIKWPHPK